MPYGSVPFLQDTAWSVIHVLPLKVGMTVLLTKKRRPVFPVKTAVARCMLMEKLGMWVTKDSVKVVPLPQHATRTPAKTSTLRCLWASVTSTAARETCAMEPKYRWSAPSCCWHALLSLFFVEFMDTSKHVILSNFANQWKGRVNLPVCQVIIATFMTVWI